MASKNQLHTRLASRLIRIWRRVVRVICLGSILSTAACQVSTSSLITPQRTTTAPTPSLVVKRVPTASLPASLTSSPQPSIIPSNTPAPFERIATIITLPASLTPLPEIVYYEIAPCLPKNATVQAGMVTRIVDGDTIEARLEDGNTYPVRYIGIDAPESAAPFSDEAANANGKMTLNKAVILVKDTSETDQYDRLLRYVIVDQQFVNLELIKLGWAAAEAWPPDTACAETFSNADQAARNSQLGIWVATQTPAPSAEQVVIVTVNKRAEYVDIQNIGSQEVNLAGWNLVSERGHQDCPLSGVIQSGEVLRIWAMTVQEPGFSCGYTSPIWNNSQPDPAVLYNAQGNEVSRK